LVEKIIVKMNNYLFFMMMHYLLMFSSLRPFYMILGSSEKDLLLKKCINYYDTLMHGNFSNVENVIDAFYEMQPAWYDFVSDKDSKDITELLVGITRILVFYDMDEIESNSQLIELMTATLTTIYHILGINMMSIKV